MISYHKQLVSTLNTILPTHYELVLHRGLDIPCISYMLLNDASTAKGNTLEYSRIQYQIKVWGNRIDEIENYAYLNCTIANVSSVLFKKADYST